MYKCDECGEVFDELKRMTEVVDDYGNGYIVTSCPYCNGDYEEVDKCDCGEYKNSDELLCDKCKIEVQKDFADFMETFTENERKFLNEIYEMETF